MQSGLSGRWVPARAWQFYWQSDKLGDLVHIGPDLAAYDVHPPLYFYVLHLWLMLTGMHHWAGPALNLVFALLTMLALFGLARALGFERLESSLVVLAWALSPAVVSISALTRQYDQVALLHRAVRLGPSAGHGVGGAAALAGRGVGRRRRLRGAHDALPDGPAAAGRLVFAVAAHLIGRRRAAHDRGYPPSSPSPPASRSPRS